MDSLVPTDIESNRTLAQANFLEKRGFPGTNTGGMPLSQHSKEALPILILYRMHLQWPICFLLVSASFSSFLPIKSTPSVELIGPFILFCRIQDKMLPDSRIENKIQLNILIKLVVIFVFLRVDFCEWCETRECFWASLGWRSWAEATLCSSGIPYHPKKK